MQRVGFITYDFDFCRLIDQLAELYKKYKKDPVGFLLMREDHFAPLYILASGKYKDGVQVYFQIGKPSFYEGYHILDLRKYNQELYQSFKSVIYNSIEGFRDAHLHGDMEDCDEYDLSCNGLIIGIIRGVEQQTDIHFQIDENMERHIQEVFGKKE